MLVVDLPAEEAGEFAPAARAAGLDTVFLVAPTTPAARVPLVIEGGGGFVYCVSVTGVTGQKKPAVETVAETVARIRPHTTLPVLVGFGVTDGASARATGRGGRRRHRGQRARQIHRGQDRCGRRRGGGRADQGLRAALG